MSKSNAGYLFYKKNFTNSPGKIDERVNAQIMGVELMQLSGIPQNTPDKSQPVSLSTTYPGLLTGTGYMHDAKGEDKAFKIGFFFDHATGMPVIPGSSVKGTLRSMFPNKFRLTKNNNDWWKEYAAPRYLFVRSCIAKISALAAEAISDDLIDAFEAELFEGVVAGKPSSNYGRDIFLDAFPVEITASNRGNRKQLFGNDYLTPHLHQNREMAHLDPFAEPRPLQFLKVMPMVRYEFHFILKPSLAIPAMDATKKRKLLEALLCFHGIGAKTNVGYGQFAQQQELAIFFENIEVEAPGPENSGPPDDDDVAKRIDPQDFVNRVVPGASPLEAVVVNSILKRVRIRVKGEDHEVQLAGNCPASVGDFIGVKINTVDRNGNITQVGYIGPYRPK